MQIFTWIFSAHFVPTMDTLFLVVLTLSTGLFMAALMFVLYMGLEPSVRRRWPQTIISWTRLLSGRVRDPLVGRDVLFGALLGAGWSVTFVVGWLFVLRMGSSPQLGSTDYLLGMRDVIGNWGGNLMGSVLGTLMFFLVLVMLRVLLRNPWLAAAVFVAIYTVPKVLSSDYPWTVLPIWLIIYGVAAFAVVRFGLVALAIGILMANLLLNLPYSLDFSIWYTSHTVFSVAIFAALAGWAAYTSMAGAKLFKEDPFA
jgi:serine/threonine-protein kinase